MIEQIKIAFEAIKHAGVYAPVSVLGASSILLFSPDAWLAKISLLSFKNQNAETIGLAFIISLVAVVVQATLWLKNNTWAPYQIRKDMEKYLHDLSVQEKQILCGYVLNGIKTQYFQVEDGVVQGLNHQQIIYRSSNVGHMIRGFAYNIETWAYEYLSKNKQLITEGVPITAPNVVQGYESEVDPRRLLRR